MAYMVRCANDTIPISMMKRGHLINRIVKMMDAMKKYVLRIMLMIVLADNICSLVNDDAIPNIKSIVWYVIHIL